MKPFSETQKKWAMASALLLVLGFNISSPRGGESHSLDLSSTKYQESDTHKEFVVEKKFISEDGVTEVQYVRRNKKEVEARIAPLKPQGGRCDECEREVHVLEIGGDNNLSDIDALNVALAKDLAKGKKEVAKDDDDKNKDKEKEKEKEEEQTPEEKKKAEIKKFTKKKLDAIEKDCRDSESGKLDCLSSGVADLLNMDSADKKLDKTLVQNFVQSTVVPQARSEFDSATRIASLALRVQMGYADGITTMQFNNLGITVEDALNGQNAVSNSLARLIETPSKEFEAVRKTIVGTENGFLQNEATRIRSQQQIATANPGSVGLSYQADALARSILLTDIGQKMGIQGINSVDLALKNKSLDYNNASIYQTVFTNMINQQATSTNNPVLDTPANRAQGLTPAAAAARLNPLGRGFNNQPGLQTLPGTSIPNTTGIGAGTFLPQGSPGGVAPISNGAVDPFNQAVVNTQLQNGLPQIPVQSSLLSPQSSAVPLPVGRRGN
ncbi:MAG TPA: hypothetical protein VN132_06600 [Bdellovibrio sp.]|nr:hypothetical protein [Bdellovibrio sp.]